MCHRTMISVQVEYNYIVKFPLTSAELKINYVQYIIKYCITIVTFEFYTFYFYNYRCYNSISTKHFN